ncbi:hypothetical protein [Paenibacillus xylanexedens]|uniref:hypothetical protein n=1 Tax=Paenibacillus xylanexedens TaxID=528191 RepID=UPI0011A3B110|nr:hypothetical protein [Paenibacillus xylanexedens]
MKVFRKQVRKITIDGVLYLYVVDEQDDNIVLRIYSNQFKSTFAEYFIRWGDSWDIGVYEPKLIARLVEYAESIGWESNTRNNKIKIENASILIREMTKENL